MPFNTNCPGCGSLGPCGCSGDQCNFVSSDNVKYIGPNLSGTGIQGCDDLTTVLQKIDYAIALIEAQISPTPSTTTTTTTTTAVINCGTTSSLSGGASYPTTQSVVLSSATGTVVLNYNAQSVPDRFIVDWNSSVVIDTGYRGSAAYDFGGGSRSSFTNSLTGLIDPITLTPYPNFSTYPDDGYPRIVGIGLGTTSFVKNLATNAFAIIKVYAPMSSTVWSYTLNCPTTTTTTTTLLV